jgi:hypothetical protein
MQLKDHPKAILVQEIIAKTKAAKNSQFFISPHDQEILDSLTIFLQQTPPPNNISDVTNSRLSLQFMALHLDLEVI